MDFFSDQTGTLGELILIATGYQADFLDSGDLVYYYLDYGVDAWDEWQGEDFWQIKYTFPYHRMGAGICVQKENEELLEIRLLQSHWL